MSSFTVRVELHDARTRQDYDALHASMEGAGFARTILGRDGVTYELPTAEYVLTANYTLEQVTNMAGRAAANWRHAVFVAETSQWMWTGLRPVRRAA